MVLMEGRRGASMGQYGTGCEIIKKLRTYYFLNNINAHKKIRKHGIYQKN